MSWRDDLAAQIAGAKTFESGSYFEDGAYPDLILDTIKMINGHNGVALVAEFRVQTATATEPGVQPNAPGSTASVAYNVTKHKDAALSNIKKLALALSGLTVEELDQEQEYENVKAESEGRAPVVLLKEWIKRATNENENAGTVQPLRGTLISGETYRQATRAQKAANAPRKDWNTYVKFRHIPDQTAESRAANVKKLDNLAAPPTADPTPPAADPTPQPSHDAPNPTPPARPSGGGLLGGVLS